MEDVNRIYERYADEVKRFLICITSNYDLAEELTQEAFYQAVKSIHRYNGECKMSVWLCQIAKHCYYDYLKKEKRIRNVSLDDMLATMEVDFPSTSGLPEPETIQRDARLSIYKEIHNLDEPYREIFMLRINTDMSFREIGEVFGKSENWARVTYYRAKTKLAERIEYYGD